MHPESDESRDLDEETTAEPSWLQEQVQLITLEDGFTS
jgi:hypothetical protein